MKKFIVMLSLVCMLLAPSFSRACDVCPELGVGRAQYVISEAPWWTGLAITNYNNYKVEVRVSIAHVGVETYTVPAYSVVTVSIDTNGLPSYLTITCSEPIEALIILSDSEVALSYKVDFE